jgi:predicted Zn-dependent peptidase
MIRALISLLIAGAAALCAQPFDRTKPPATPPIPDYKLPPIEEGKLGNGLAVVMVEDSRFPLVTARLTFQGGSRNDPADMPGLAENVAALLVEGTATRTSRKIAEQTAAIGGSLSGTADADGLTLAGLALSENSGKLLELLADVARNASFPENEVGLRKQNRKQALMQELSNPRFLATREFHQLVYGQHPYAHIGPTMQSLDTLDRKAVVAHRDRYLVPNNAVLILVGKLPPRAETMKMIEAQFGSWARKDVSRPAEAPLPESRRQLVLVDRPGSVQADIHVGRLAATRTDPDYYPLYIGRLILGGGMSSRMFVNIREKEGFAYDAHAEQQPNREAGTFAAVTQVRNDVLEPALKAVVAELDRMENERVSAEEMSNAKNLSSGAFLLRLENQNALADQFVMMRNIGLPNEYLEKFTSRVRAVEPDQVQAAAKKYMAPDKAVIVVVGDSSKIGKVLEKFGSVTVTKVEP